MRLPSREMINNRDLCVEKVLSIKNTKKIKCNKLGIRNARCRIMMISKYDRFFSFSDTTKLIMIDISEQVIYRRAWWCFLCLNPCSYFVSLMDTVCSSVSIDIRPD